MLSGFFFFSPQQSETKNWQEENVEIYQWAEIKQHNLEQPMRRKNQKGNKYLSTKKNGDTTYQNLRDAAKIISKTEF